LTAGLAPRASSFCKTLAGLRFLLRPPVQGALPWAPAGLGSTEASPWVLSFGPAAGGPNGQSPSLDFARRAHSVRPIRLPAEWSLPANLSCLPKDKFVGSKLGRAVARPQGSRQDRRESKGTKRQICGSRFGRTECARRASAKEGASQWAPGWRADPARLALSRGRQKAHSLCLCRRALLSDAILHRIEDRGSPSVANPLGGTRIHWTRVSSASPLARP
jgi:hypothetical protein